MFSFQKHKEQEREKEGRKVVKSWPQQKRVEFYTSTTSTDSYICNSILNLGKRLDCLEAMILWERSISGSNGDYHFQTCIYQKHTAMPNHKTDQRERRNTRNLLHIGRVFLFNQSVNFLLNFMIYHHSHVDIRLVLSDM